MNLRPLQLFSLVALAALRASADPAADAYREARAHLVAHRYAEAAARFEAATATTNATFAAAAWFGRGEALSALRQWDDAIAAYERLLTAYPSDPLAPKALYARGFAEQGKGQLPKALDTFSAFKSQYPTNALFASCTNAIGMISRTLDSQARQKAVEQVTKELAAINAAVREEKFDAAREAAARFLQSRPDHPQSAELRYLMATCAYRAKAYDRAAEIYRDFLDRHPQHARAAAARAQLADSLLLAKRFEAARAAYAALAAETSDPREKARAALSEGDCAAALEKWGEAERLYLSVEALEGSEALRPAARARLADLYDRSGESEKARLTREDLRRRYPNR